MANTSILAAFERLWQHITVALSDKSDISHIHDDRYYTESEVDTLLADKSDSAHNHDSAYDSKGSADTALASAKEYTDSVASGKANTSHTHDDIYYTESEVDQKLENKADSIHNHDDAYDKIGTANTTVSSHNASVDAHNDIRLLITDLTTKLNNFLDVDDATTDQLSEVLTLIDANKGTLESLTSNKINVSDIVNNLTTNSTDKVLSAAQGVAIKGLIDALQEAVNGKADEGHGHVINDVSGLQTALDSKAASSHNHTVANITDLTVTTTELNYMSGVISEVQTQIDGKADSSTTLAGYGITDAYTKTEVDGKIPTIEIVRW